MKIEVKNHCIRCGICVGLYPQLFAHNFEKDCIDVKCDHVPEELERMAKQAAVDCAVTAIFLLKEAGDIEKKIASSTGLTGKWLMSVNSPMGELKPVLDLKEENGVVTGTMCDGEHEPAELVDCTFKNDEFTCGASLATPLGNKKIKLFLKLDGDELSGKVKLLMISMDAIGRRG